jgi:hypothetical protein
MQWRPAVRSRVTVICVVLLAACQQKSPEEKLVKDVGPAISWAASLQFAAEKWLANSAPNAFVRASAEAGEKAFEKAKKSVAESKADSKLRSVIGAQIDAANDAAGDLRDAVKRGDRRAGARVIARFASAHEALEKIEKESGGE